MKKTLLFIFLIISLLLPILSTPISAASAPTLNIKKVTNIDYDAAEVSTTFKCTKKDNFLSYGVLYGTSETEMNERYLIRESEKPLSVPTASKSITLQNLQSDTTYYCCVYAVDAAGNTHTGKATTFTTKAYVGEIIVTTGVAANIKYNSATVDLSYAEVDGCKISTKGFYYGTSMDNMKKVTLTGKTVAKTISNLTPESTYYYYAFVKAAKDGRVFAGETRTFTTPPQFYGKINVTTGEATNVEYKTATLNLSYETEAPAKFDKCGFYYGTSVDDMKKVACSKNTTSKDIKGLKGGTSYIWYPYAVAKDGREFVGETQSFTTLDPKVPTKIEINCVTSKIYRYDAIKVDVEITPSTAKSSQVIWTISDDNVLEKNGSWLKARNPGTATLTVSTPDGTVFDTLTVTVKDELDWDTAPLITSIKALGEDKIYINWKRPDLFWPDAKLCYEVYRSTSEDGPFERIEVTSQTNTTDDTALRPDTTYYYKVQCYEKSKNNRYYQFTDFSETVSATTKEHIYVPKKDKTEPNNGVILPNTGSDSSIIEPNPGTIPPVVSGLQEAYTIAKGDTLNLNFFVEDSVAEMVEKVTVKHNVAGSISTSITNETPGQLTCRFLIADKLFDNAGTYEFCVYARTTNFTVTNNLIAKFNVMVIDTACKHTKTTSAEKETVFTDLILTDSTHTSYTVYTESCAACGADLGEFNGETTTAGHTLKSKGYCECGYIDVSGFVARESYNQTGLTQTVYRTPESQSKWGSIYAGEAVTVLGEWGDRYLIEYALDGGGVKQGYVPKSVIPDEVESNSDLLSKEDLYRQTLSEEQYDLWKRLKKTNLQVLDNNATELLFEHWADEYEQNLVENIKTSLRAGFDGAQALLSVLTLDLTDAYEELQSISNTEQRIICYKNAIKEFMSTNIDSSIKADVESAMDLVGDTLADAADNIDGVYQIYKEYNTETAKIIAKIAQSMDFKRFNIKSSDLFERLQAVSINIDGKQHKLTDYVNLKKSTAVELRVLLKGVKDSDSPVNAAKDLCKMSIVEKSAKIAKGTGTFIAATNTIVEMQVMREALDKYGDDLADYMEIADPLFVECIEEVIDEYYNNYSTTLIKEEALILGSYLFEVLSDELELDDIVEKWLKNQFPKYAQDIDSALNLAQILKTATDIIESGRDFLVNTAEIASKLDGLPSLRNSISSARTTCISKLCQYISNPTPKLYNEIISAVSYYEFLGMVGTDVMLGAEADEYNSLLNKVFGYSEMDEEAREEIREQEMKKLRYFHDILYT